VYRNLASNEQAWQETRGIPAITDVAFPADDMLWGTAATAHATSWGHMDDHGVATIVKVIAGSKYWVVARPKRDRANMGTAGDMGTANAFTDEWEPSTAGDEFWDMEGVLLRAGDTL
jgi:hypothetical protein